MCSPQNWKTLARVALGLSLALAAAGASAQSTAGEVEFSRGVGFAQTPGQTPRTLGKGRFPEHRRDEFRGDGWSYGHD